MSDVISTPAAAADRHPIGLIVTDDLHRTRLTVFFRLLIAIPAVIWVALWGIAVDLAVIAAWFVAGFTGRGPAGLRKFKAAWLRCATPVRGYVGLRTVPV